VWGGEGTRFEIRVGRRASGRKEGRGNQRYVVLRAAAMLPCINCELVGISNLVGGDGDDGGGGGACLALLGDTYACQQSIYRDQSVTETGSC
jgi:hypothetical protein